ncbi:hypothetical protein EON65_13390 [archaeon]|nr:MAG: hypothetical protein EON65_13390 [archaeon]
MVWYDPSSVSLGWISSNKPAMHDTKTPASCELNKSIQHTLPTNNEGLGKEILNDDDRIHFKETQNKSEREGMSSKMVSTRELLQEKRTEQMDSEVLLDRTPTPIDTLTISTKAEVNVDMTALVEQVDQKNLEDVITCSPGLPHKVRDHRVPMFSPREQPSSKFILYYQRYASTVLMFTVFS